MGLDVYLARGESGKPVTYGEGADAETYTEYEDREYYLQSSYNESGFNQVTEKVLGIGGYYWVFETWVGSGSEYEYPCTDREALDECLRRARILKNVWRAQIEKGVYSCFTVTGHHSTEQQPTSARQVMDLFRGEQVRWGDPKTESSLFDAYSNQYGYFDRKGLAVQAVILGVEYGRPCAYVVFKMSDEGAAYYLEAAQKAVELVTEAITMLEAGSTPVINWSA